MFLTSESHINQHECNPTCNSVNDLFSFYFLCIFLFKQNMYGHIRDRKEIHIYVKHLTLHFCYAEAYRCHWHAMPKQTDVIDTALLLCRSIQVSYYDWQATVVRWLFIPFSKATKLTYLVVHRDAHLSYKRYKV